MAASDGYLDGEGDSIVISSDASVHRSLIISVSKNRRRASFTTHFPVLSDLLFSACLNITDNRTCVYMYRDLSAGACNIIH